MTEYERMRAGRIYDCMDAELGAAQRESHRLCEAYNALGADYNAFLLVFVGVVTGVGGGVLRDVLAGLTPYIFRKHVYASASILGAVLCVVLMPYTGDAWAIAIGMAAVVITRLLSAYFRWNLPHAGLGVDEKEE